MAKKMYQKREERKNKPERVVDTNKTNINWQMGSYGKPTTNHYE